MKRPSSFSYDERVAQETMTVIDRFQLVEFVKKKIGSETQIEFEPDEIRKW